MLTQREKQNRERERERETKRDRVKIGNLCAVGLDFIEQEEGEGPKKQRDLSSPRRTPMKYFEGYSYRTAFWERGFCPPVAGRRAPP